MERFDEEGNDVVFRLAGGIGVGVLVPVKEFAGTRQAERWEEDRQRMWEWPEQPLVHFLPCIRHHLSQLLPGFFLTQVLLLHHTLHARSYVLPLLFKLTSQSITICTNELATLNNFGCIK